MGPISVPIYNTTFSNYLIKNEQIYYPIYYTIIIYNNIKDMIKMLIGKNALRHFIKKEMEN